MGDPMGTEVVINDKQPEDTSVLADAAVQAAAVSGVAAATAVDAKADAEQANDKADNAQGTADVAVGIAASKTGPDEVAAIVDAKLTGFKDELLTAIRETTPAAEPVVVTAAPKDEPPKSVEQVEHRTWYEKFLGV